MRILILIITLTFSLISFSQDCFVQKKRSVKILKKVNDNLYHYSFQDVKDILVDIQNREGVSAQIFDIYSLIYWLNDDLLKAEEYARKTLLLCWFLAVECGTIYKC